ncbi:beta-D-glucosyl crocetin beta-1,6-glucosyltransferase-like [Euphorbia lathyris]|uniref:beta-D-glucosyl crocetin beta-1,6-glucosyltransferase-like n=1 Tax=Euphorbia lathyris TaxID=212925 RepID=UPI00331447A7
MEKITREEKIRVLMFPWLAHGHISPFLELAKRLSKKNFHICFCSTPINLNFIKKTLSPNYSLSIQLIELHLPSLPSLPPHFHTTKGLPPHLMPTLKKAFDNSSPSFLKILEILKPDLLIYDFIQPWAPIQALNLNIPSVFFLCSSISMAAFVIQNTDMENLFPEICPGEYFKNKSLDVLRSSSNERKDIDRFIESWERSSRFILAKTYREIEGEYIDYLSGKMMKNIIPTGPLVEEQEQEDNSNMNEVKEWLEKKKRFSTVFVSFGSEYFLTKQEREEIAKGLELSGVNFIWVIRFPKGEEIKLEDSLPERFLERVKERGKVVEGWIPQGRILRDSKVGGFVSHCGWSSVMESMKFGVPIIGLPMNLDQPVNARLVEHVGVGIEVKRSENGEIEREEIAQTIRKVVVEKSGDFVRKKVREMSNVMIKKREEEIDVVVHELLQLL